MTKEVGTIIHDVNKIYYFLGTCSDGNSYLSHQNLIMDDADYIPYQFILAHIIIKSIYSPLLKETNNMSDKWIDIKYGT